MKNKLLALLALACFGIGAAQADTLNFDVFGTDDLGTKTLVMPNATVTGFADSLYNVAGFGLAGGTICSYVSSKDSCEADLKIDFNDAVSGLTFGVYGYDPGDFVRISAYAGGSLLGSVDVASDMLVDFSSFSGITRLHFDDSSTGYGYAYGDFSFTVAAVPEPETWGLLLGGLGLVGLMARRRRLPHHSLAA